MALPVKFPLFDFFDQHLPFAKDDASPAELWRLGQQSLADGWRMARAYFRAAGRVAADRSAAWLARHGHAAKRTSLAPVVHGLEIVEANPFRRRVAAEGERAAQQLQSVFAPVWAKALELILPLPRFDLRYGLAALLVADMLLWGGMVGLFGLSTVEGRRAPLEAIAAKAVEPPAAVNLPPPLNTLAGGEASAEAVLTATPIALEATATPVPPVYSAWTPTLPAEVGWTGEGACFDAAYAPIGSGYFIWPADNHYLSGYDYSIYHLGLDVTVWLGDAIYAADAGAVVYAGWNDWGYGNLIIIDHGNGWHTLYGHLSQVNVVCGQGVAQGELIGLAGSTGHSTGPHLHFEMRAGDGRVNPWWYLP